MAELSFLLDTISELLRLVVAVFLLRFLLQVVRADFRNPVAQFIVRFTNPLVLPLRKALPPIGRTDTASVAAVLLVQILVTALGALGTAGHLPPGLMVAMAILQLAETTLRLYQVAIFVYVLLSWVSPTGYHPAGRLLGQLCEPIIAPLRRRLPALAGLDISPMIVLLLIQLLLMELPMRVRPLLLDLLG